MVSQATQVVGLLNDNGMYVPSAPGCHMSPGLSQLGSLCEPAAHRALLPERQSLAEGPQQNAF